MCTGETTGEDYCLTKANLEILGEKFNIKREKNNEKRFLVNRAALIIQKEAKKFLVKIRAEKKRINHNVLCIQNITRRKIAYFMYNNRLRFVSAVKLQRF